MSYWLLRRSMECEKASGRKCWTCMRSKPLSVGKFVHHRYDLCDLKKCMHVHISSIVLASDVERGRSLGVFVLHKCMVDRLGYLEVWRFLNLFFSEMWSHINMRTDIRYPLCTFIYPLWYTMCHLLSDTYFH